MCVCELDMCVSEEVDEGAGIAGDGVLFVNHLTRVLATGLESSGRATGTLNRWANFSSPNSKNLNEHMQAFIRKFPRSIWYVGPTWTSHSEVSK